MTVERHVPYFSPDEDPDDYLVEIIDPEVEAARAKVAAAKEEAAKEALKSLDPKGLKPVRSAFYIDKKKAGNIDELHTFNDSPAALSLHGSYQQHFQNTQKEVELTLSGFNDTLLLDAMNSRTRRNYVVRLEDGKTINIDGFITAIENSYSYSSKETVVKVKLIAQTVSVM